VGVLRLRDLAKAGLAVDASASITFHFKYSTGLLLQKKPHSRALHRHWNWRCSHGNTATMVHAYAITGSAAAESTAASVAAESTAVCDSVASESTTHTFASLATSAGATATISARPWSRVQQHVHSPVGLCR
jgi:hypothetical protein